MSFSHLGADEFKLIYIYSGYWPGFWKICSATYLWMRETLFTEKRTSQSISLARFSDHVHNYKEFEAALAVTSPTTCCNLNRIISLDLLRNLVRNAELWKTDVFPPSTRRRPYMHVLRRLEKTFVHGELIINADIPRVPNMGNGIWVRAAYEAAVAGRKDVVEDCLWEVSGIALEIVAKFISRVHDCHNSHGRVEGWIFHRLVWQYKQFKHVRGVPMCELAFNESIYVALQHRDSSMIEFIIMNVDIDLAKEDSVSRWAIKELARQPGMEACFKVLNDHQFFHI